MSRNPIDITEPQEQKIAKAVLDAFDVARGLPLAEIEAAIERGSAVLLFRPTVRDGAGAEKETAWGEFLRTLEEALPDPIAECAEHGARHAVKSAARSAVSNAGGFAIGTAVWIPSSAHYKIEEISAAARKPILLDPEITELGADWARTHSAQLIRGIDARTRANLRRLIRNAARRLARNPRGVVLEQLAREIREQIGLTTRQGAQLSKAIRSWIDQGKTSAAVTALKKARIESMLTTRARRIAGREVAESFNEGILRAAKRAEKLNRISGAQKIARTVGDENVRELHTTQANMGAIPLADNFPIFDAARPPWPGEPG